MLQQSTDFFLWNENLKKEVKVVFKIKQLGPLLKHLGYETNQNEIWETNISHQYINIHPIQLI